MLLAKVTGSMVSTQKVDTMTGHKLLLVDPQRVDPRDGRRLIGTGRSFVAVDTVGSGHGELVIITQGASARLTPETRNLPVDTTIVGIVDSVYVGHTCIYDKEGEDTT